MGYTTQMNAARQKIVTKEMQAVAAWEGIGMDRLLKLVANGQAVIPANKNHKCLKPFGIGSALKTKINVNLGTSRDCMNMDVELEKVMNAVNMGAEAIMDLSSFGDTRVFRRKLTAECPAILGTVPIYDAIVYYNKPLDRRIQNACRGWRRLYDDPLRAEQEHSRALQAIQAAVESCFTRRQLNLFMDGTDRQ